MSQAILLRIISPQAIAQDLNDDLLIFVNGGLTFFSYPIRYHSPQAKLNNTEEKVMGFQAMTCFELTLSPQEASDVINYLTNKSYRQTLSFKQLIFQDINP